VSARWQQHQRRCRQHHQKHLPRFRLLLPRCVWLPPARCPRLLLLLLNQGHPAGALSADCLHNTS
jgi:hypothetical protein